MMKILLDTQILVWYALDIISPSIEPYIYNVSNRIYFSAASIWEVAIKNSKKLPSFHVDPYMLLDGLIENGYQQLSIDISHAAYTGKLPMIHKDPFDRILISQAILEGITLITTDNLIAKYPVPIILV